MPGPTSIDSGKWNKILMTIIHFLVSDIGSLSWTSFPAERDNSNLYQICRNHLSTGGLLKDFPKYSKVYEHYIERHKSGGILAINKQSKPYSVHSLCLIDVYAVVLHNLSGIP